MGSSSLIKVVAAFLAGIVITLGGVRIYQRTNEMIHPQLVVRPATQTTDVSTPQDRGSVTGQDSSDAATQTPPVPQEDATPAPKPVHKFHPKTRVASAKPAPPEEIAQNSPPTPPATDQPQEPQPAPDQSAAPQSSGNPPPGPAPQENSVPPAPPQNPAPPTPQTPAPQPHTVTLPSGTNVVVRLAEALSSNDNYTGDTFRATLESPIIADGFVIADKGSKVLGRLATVKKAGRVEGVAELTLALTEINTTDGQRVKIETSTWDKRGPKSTNEDAAKIAGGAAVGAIIGAVAGGGKGAAIGAGAGGAAGTGAAIATRGKTATLPIETRLTFRLSSPLTITEKLNQ